MLDGAQRLPRVTSRAPVLLLFGCLVFFRLLDLARLTSREVTLNSYCTLSCRGRCVFGTFLGCPRSPTAEARDQRLLKPPLGRFVLTRLPTSHPGYCFRRWPTGKIDHTGFLFPSPSPSLESIGYIPTNQPLVESESNFIKSTSLKYPCDNNL